MANTTQIGIITEAVVLAAIVKSGRTVLIPFGSQQNYDLIIEDNNCFYKVQCKTGRLKQGAVHFNLYTMAQKEGTGQHIRRSYGENVDLFGVYCHDTDKVYLVPRSDVASAVGVLRVEPPANNQTKNIRWAKDYEV